MTSVFYIKSAIVRPSFWCMECTLRATEFPTVLESSILCWRKATARTKHEEPRIQSGFFRALRQQLPSFPGSAWECLPGGSASTFGEVVACEFYSQFCLFPHRQGRALHPTLPGRAWEREKAVVLVHGMYPTGHGATNGFGFFYLMLEYRDSTTYSL